VGVADQLTIHGDLYVMAGEAAESTAPSAAAKPEASPPARRK